MKSILVSLAGLISLLGYCAAQSTTSANPDQGCPAETPARCPRPDPYNINVQGPCMKDYSQCGIAQICYRAEQSYQCPDGTCQNRFDNCENQELDCKDKRVKRCPDGYCRNDCNTVRYSNCPMELPLLCPQGNCRKYLFECAGGHFCNLNTPFLCPDMSCMVNLRSCPATTTGRNFETVNFTYDPTIENINFMITKQKAANLEFHVTYDAFNAPKFSPFSGKNISQIATMFFEPVSLGELRPIQNVLNTTLASVVKDFYMISEETIPYHITIRSSAFKIYSLGRYDDFEYFKTPIMVKMDINSIRRNGNSVSNLSVDFQLNRITFVSERYSSPTEAGLAFQETSEMRLTLPTRIKSPQVCSTRFPDLEPML